MKAILVRSMRDARITFASPKGHVAMNTEASGLAQKVVVRSLLPSAERLVHRVVVKAFAHLRVARRAGACIMVAVARGGWGVDSGIGLAEISSRSHSAVRVRGQTSEAHAVLNHVLSSIVAPPPSSLGSSAVVSTTEQARSTSGGRCSSLSNLGSSAVVSTPEQARSTSNARCPSRSMMA